MSVMKVLIETEQFLEWLKTKYLPTWESTFEFLTALKDMNFVRFFEYYEKACRYFDIPKEKTIFAIKELKETQQFAEKLHKEEVEKAGFKH